MPNTQNNQRIAKNTLLLYFRMMLIMLVSLYTVRVVLNTLGVLDFGIYNVVGGVVVMFSFLSNTMASASQRFFAFDIGRNDMPQLKRTFSMTIIIYLIIAVIILLLAETVGLWFLNTQMVIPPDRMEAANWIYQFSILSFLVTIMIIPFNAIIIARENMSVYAYVSIVEVILKLGVVYLLVLFTFDKLKLYAILMFATTLITSGIYFIICKRKYEETNFKYYWDKDLFKTLISYSGWNLFGAVAGVINNQGINILLNVFFGPVVNAARGIAYQVSSAVNQFVMSFTTAVNPQITKYYAMNEKEKMIDLVFKSSKYSFFLVFILATPVLLETHFILALWLKIVPDYVVLFTRLVIINALIDSLSFSLQTVAQATGKIKFYQSVVGGTMLLNLPISYLLLYLKFLPQITIYVSIVISIVCLILRLLMLKKLVHFPISQYYQKVIKTVVITSILSLVFPLIIIFQMDGNASRFIIVVLISLMLIVLSIFYVGLSVKEQQYFINEIKYKIVNKLKY
jgi:O-antigen/teichoic acid export membrane protein